MFGVMKKFLLCDVDGNIIKDYYYRNGQYVKYGSTDDSSKLKDLRSCALSSDDVNISIENNMLSDDSIKDWFFNDKIEECEDWKTRIFARRYGLYGSDEFYDQYKNSNREKFDLSAIVDFNKHVGKEAEKSFEYSDSWYKENFSYYSGDVYGHGYDNTYSDLSVIDVVISANSTDSLYDGLSKIKVTHPNL